MFVRQLSDLCFAPKPSIADFSKCTVNDLVHCCSHGLSYLPVRSLASLPVVNSYKREIVRNSRTR